MRASASRSIAGGLLLALAACNAEFRFDERASVEDAGSRETSTADVDDGDETFACKADVDCAVPGLRCDVASGRCVACLEEAHCTLPSRAHCDLDTMECVGCLTHEQCGPRQRCEDVTHTCVDTCFDADDVCPTPGFVCDGSSHRCIECTYAANCASSPRRPYCETVTGRCVECLGNAQCPKDKPRCDRCAGRCVGCLGSNECGPGQVCDPGTFTCVALH
ncbi:hypothetical protein AKJ09_08939 [Labilithrix luteola]|uniref:Tryptophan synthase alpha chain n=1 Tax=Labilithrix luteola TaxID=1391654 RepID=A0A0K1Q912_9BACT|nr:hypothetical protein [Labilithrix luteola]AKV02276.1 hypothetical protein AKJ09_08939 [Labilithrix luteola]